MRTMLVCEFVTRGFLSPLPSRRHQAEHKIQSQGGSSGLTLTLEGVPKTLGTLSHTWAPDSFVVSFKVTVHRRRYM